MSQNITESASTVLQTETMDFVWSLVDDFYNKDAYQLNVENNEKWNRIVEDLIGSAKSGSLEKKVIKTRDGKEDYLIRYYLINERPKLRVTLHNALLSDEGPVHNHPWPYASLILAGGYWENTPDGRKWWGPGSFRTNSASSLHRLEIDPSVGDVWTLFFMGEKEQDWGFLNENGNIEQWQEFLFRSRGIWYEDK